MNRRTFIQQASTGLASSLIHSHFFNDSSYRASYPFLLSSHGSGRATAYSEANKIISFDQKIHFTWLDSDSTGFRVKMRSYYKAKKEWSPTYDIGPAYDNHGGAAITVDSLGYLHIVYYPHHHEMRYRKSLRPNDASSWGKEVRFGKRCTYPTLICGPDDILYFCCRRSFNKDLWHMELWTKAPNKKWSGPRILLRSQFPDYAHFQESLAWGPEFQSLHLACRIHEKTDKKGYGRRQTIGYMKSYDFGASWFNSNGEKMDLPSNSSAIEQIEKGGVDTGRILRSGAIAVDQVDCAYLVYTLEEQRVGRSYLVKLNGKGLREELLLNSFLPDYYKNWGLFMPGGISINSQNEIFIIAQMEQLFGAESSWGHPSSEIILLHSKDQGRHFSFQLMSEVNVLEPNWIPSIERPTGFNHVNGRPAMMYTSGSAGRSNVDIMSNKVFACI